ncbi:MFS transporter [Streptomyces sp. NPDC048106]|uniref:MFS transporter n=1 Tax=Streptomyces sp. NPDC048106 TaxID=3155750 RepID=UPI003452F596
MNAPRPAGRLRGMLPAPGAERALAASTLSRSIGNGIVVTVVVLYFTRRQNLPAGKVGLALTLAALAAMAASVPAGRLADLLGTRRVAVAALILQGLAIAGYAAVHTFTGFLAAAAAVAVADSASTAARGALVATAVPRDQRIRTRAYLRAVTNAAFSAGALAGGLVIAADTPAAYTAALPAGGALFLLSGLLLLPIPDPPPEAAPEGAPRWIVLRDRGYMNVGLLNAVLIMNAGMLNIALPIWMTRHTHVPSAAFSAFLLVNTALVVLCQIPASRGVTDVPTGARALRRSGLWLAACCTAFAAAATGPVWWAALLLTAGVVAQSTGELLYSAGSWALSYDLAPEHAHGQYQGMFGLTSQLGTALTPAVTTFVILGYGPLGWLLLGLALAAAGAAAPAVAAHAQRTRPFTPRPPQPAPH